MAETTGKKKGDWISGAIKHPGALHRDLGVAMGEKIPEAKLSAAVAGKYGKKTAARARFARELHGFHSSQ
jgi:hypothetical protein